MIPLKKYSPHIMAIAILSSCPSSIAFSQVMYEYDASGNIILITTDGPNLYKSQSVVSIISPSPIARLMPNPTQGIINIEMLNTELGDIFVTVSDLHGNYVLPTRKIENYILDLSAFKNGWYIVSIECGKIAENHKILKYSK